MQIRNKVITLLSKYRNDDNINAEIFNQDLFELSKIEDLSYLSKLLFKEIITADENYKQTCALFILEIIPNDILENEIIKHLSDKKISDEIKIFIVSIARQKEIPISSDEIKKYIKNSFNAIHQSIKNFLKNFNEDIETQIDFLDFYTNIELNERICFLNNLLDEYDDKNITPIFSILAKIQTEKEEYDIIQNYLLNSTNVDALDGLEEIKRIENKEENIKKIEKQIKKIKFLNKIEKKEFINKSKIYQCFIGFVDGQNEFSLAFSRIDNDSKIILALFTLNTQKGITSSIGFNKIGQEAFETILSRVYREYPPIKITPIALKSLFKYYKEVNYKTNTQIPYETFVWEKLLDDVRVINFSIDKFINSKLEFTELNDKKVNKLIKSEFFSSWFYIYNQNKYFDNLINRIENTKDFSIKNIDKIMLENILKNIIEDEQYIANLKNNLLLQGYIAKLANRKISSSIMYSICLHEKYINRFIISIFKRSIYQYFLNRKLDLESNYKENRFKAFKNAKLTLDEINKILSEIEDKWKLIKE